MEVRLLMADQQVPSNLSYNFQLSLFSALRSFMVLAIPALVRWTQYETVSKICTSDHASASDGTYSRLDSSMWVPRNVSDERQKKSRVWMHGVGKPSATTLAGGKLYNHPYVLIRGVAELCSWLYSSTTISYRRSLTTYITSCGHMLGTVVWNCLLMSLGRMSSWVIEILLASGQFRTAQGSHWDTTLVIAIPWQR